MKTIVLDLGGVVYSYSNKFDAIEHEEEFKKGLEKLDGMTEFRSIHQEYVEKGGTKRVLEAEYYLVSNGLLEVFPIVEAVARINSEFKKDSIVIVSTSLKKTSEEILVRVGINKKPDLIFDMSDYGSKKDPNSWKEILKTLTNVEIIVEDSSKNLEAAGIAAKELGYNPRLYSNVKDVHFNI